MKFKYEFEDNTFTKGYCYDCPLSYTDSDSRDWNRYCVLGFRYDECPLEEVVE